MVSLSGPRQPSSGHLSLTPRLTVYVFCFMFKSELVAWCLAFGACNEVVSAMDGAVFAFAFEKHRTDFHISDERIREMAASSTVLSVGPKAKNKEQLNKKLLTKLRAKGVVQEGAWFDHTDDDHRRRLPTALPMRLILQ